MRLAPAAEFAIRGSLILAQNYGRGPVSIKRVCEMRGLGQEYLTKIFASLNRAGIVSSVRGKGGGYVLARAPRAVSLLDIIEAVEGPLALNFCQEDPPRCDEEDCPIEPVWAELQEVVTRKLGAMTLADAVNGNGRPPEA